MISKVTVDIKDHIGHVRLNNPQKLNALNNEMFAAIIAAGEQFAQDRNVRVVVLSGEGPAFCAGLDLDVFKQPAAQRKAAVDIVTRSHGIANGPQQAALQWKQLPMPVIAAVHGAALGGGFQLCLGADMRIVHPATRMGMIEVKWGLVPDMCGILLLRDLVRADVLAEIIYAARTFDGNKAFEWGIASKVTDDPLAAALELAREIAGKSPDAVRAAKRLLTMTDTTFAARLLKAESEEQLALFETANHHEAVRAGLEKRAAVFVD